MFMLHRCAERAFRDAEDGIVALVWLAIIGIGWTSIAGTVRVFDWINQRTRRE
jgi:hypothetical protein